ncbi:cadherin-like domain-containing protein, partial [Candidatus Dojkabacteria bacterium]|nr:cadherin-like domain-containing protein [Candidatus Dojkabacteria bacterium]
YGINNGVDGDITIEGNFFNQNSFGIVQTVGNAVTRQDVSNDIHPGFTRVGGTNALTGSLCNGIEENCFDKNIVAGFYSIDTTINNKSTILSENDFSYGNGSDNNQSVLEVWKGTFEIFSNEHRRTDLTPASIDIDFIPQITTDYYTAFFPSYEVIGYVNNTPQCLELSASCPDDLSTANNNENTSIVGLYLDVAGTPYNLGTLGAPYYSYYWPHMPTGTYQIDTPHFASQEFSFDGDATTDPIDGYPSRDLGGVFYSDRGEPWTDLSGLDSKSLERFQIMEVELVDGNPVKQQDNSFIITVDVATDNQDNVSNSGYDDGSGVYSGGGNEGPDGLANGETTLREAILVANSHPGLDKIEFASGVTTIALTSPLPEITDPIFIDGKKTVIIDGTSAGSTNGFTINSSGSTIQNLTIKNFSGNGISILSGTNNKISRNSIYQNNQLGIDLNNDGVTANDVLDNDTGANNLQNYPVIAAAGKGSIQLVGSINSQPNTNYVIEFFYNQNKDTSGYGEGEIFVGDLAVATDANGNASFQTTYDYPAEVGKYMTATLTDPSGNTSEFSQAVQISLAPDAVDDNVSTPGQVIIDVLSNDSDLDGSLDLNTLKIIVDPQHGTVIINYENGTITYIPDPGYFGIDSFTYIICDNTGLCDTAVVNINVIQDLNPKDTPIITATPSLANTVAPTVGIELIDLPKTGSGASTNNLFNTYLALIPLMGAILTAVLVYPRAILYALLWLKRPHNPVWGQTLNDDKAIKFVKIQLKRYGELYAETISNSNGEYGFQVPAGDYVLKTTHPAFVTFNKNIRVKNSKEYNLNIEIHKKNFSKETSFRNIYFRTREIILRSLHNINATLFMIGLIWSIFATYRYPILFNVLIMLIYLVLIIWNTLSSDLYFKAFHKNNS